MECGAAHGCTRQQPKLQSSAPQQAVLCRSSVAAPACKRSCLPQTSRRGCAGRQWHSSIHVVQQAHRCRGLGAGGRAGAPRRAPAPALSGWGPPAFFYGGRKKRQVTTAGKQAAGVLQHPLAFDGSSCGSNHDGQGSGQRQQEKKLRVVGSHSQVTPPRCASRPSASTSAAH